MGCGGIISAKEGKMIMENRLKYWNGTSFEDRAPEAGEFETHLTNTTTAHGVDTKADASVVAAHLAQNVTKVVVVTEPFEQMTKTTVNLGFKPKSVQITGVIRGLPYSFTGYADSDTQAVNFFYADNNNYDMITGFCLYYANQTEEASIRGSVELTETGLEITWAKSTASLPDGEGNRRYVIHAITHGEET